VSKQKIPWLRKLWARQLPASFHHSSTHLPLAKIELYTLPGASTIPSVSYATSRHIYNGSLESIWKLYKISRSPTSIILAQPPKKLYDGHIVATKQIIIEDRVP
jgi:hypothetical protein